MRLTPPADPRFTRRFLAALPPDVAASFTPDQIAAVQRCFGLRHAGRHPLDIRRSLWTPFGRIYLVLLAGAERRAEDPTRSLRRAGKASVAAAASLAVLAGVAVCLLLLKRLAGIDVIPGLDALPDEALIVWLMG